MMMMMMMYLGTFWPRLGACNGTLLPSRQMCFERRGEEANFKTVGANVQMCTGGSRRVDSTEQAHPARLERKTTYTADASILKV